MNYSVADDPPVAAFAGTNVPEPVVRGGFRRLETILLTLALSAMVVLPVADMLLRALGVVLISSSATLVQHLTLFTSMAGGAAAAGDGRLLRFGTMASILPPRVERKVRAVAFAGATAIAGLLTVASAQFVIAERESEATLLGRLPLWIVELVLPLGFAVITCRLVRGAGERHRTRLGAALAAAVVAGLLWLAPLTADQLVVPLCIAIGAGAAAGMPVFAVLGGLGLALSWSSGLPIAAMPVEHYRLAVNPALPAIPLFTLAGYFLAEGGSARRLVGLIDAWVGHIRGGPAIAGTLLCAVFTAFTGASGVTILALGGLMLPVLRGVNMRERSGLGLLTGAGALGVLLPPCLPVVLYAMVAQIDARAMFVAALVPACLLIVLAAGWGVLMSPPIAAKPRFSWNAAWHAAWVAKWEMLLPVVALVPLFSGWASAVEVSALTALYAFLVVTFIHRDLNVRDVAAICRAGGSLVGGILLILGVALGLTNFLVDAQVPDTVAQWSLAHISSRFVFLLGLNLVLLLIGGFVEIYAAIIVVVPLLVPIGLTLGIDPMHLGVIFLANMELGFLAPPIGLNLLLASSRLQRPLGEIVTAVFPLLVLLFLGVLLITYVPALSLALPGWLGFPR